MIEIKVDTKDVKKKFKNINRDLDKLIKQAYGVFVKNTPKRSGNARNKTGLTGNEIRANYPYAKRLDEGYSRQSPKGMVEPTVDFIEKAINKIIRENR